MVAVNSMKIRAKLTGDMTEIKLIISHPMETGRKKNDFDQIIPAHFIQLVSITLNDIPVLEAQWGTGIAKNPYLTFRIKGAKVGDKVNVTWLDSLGQSGTQDALVVQS